MSGMEVTIRFTPKVVIKTEVRGVEEMFQQVGPLQEIANACKCGKCQSENIRLNHRKNKFDFYELVCEDCNHKLALGKNDQGHLFPRRYKQDPADKKKALMKEGRKVMLPNNGWTKWNPASENEDDE